LIDQRSASRSTFFLLTLLFSVGCATTASRSTTSATLDRIVERYHQDEKFSGTVLVGRGAEVIYRRAIGFADEEWRVPIRMDTRFRIGSLTKQYTGAMVLEAAKSGALDLDAPLSRYLPDQPRTAADSVTLRHLLTHTSGIPDFVRRPDIMEIVMHSVTPAELSSKYCSGPLEFTPGSQFKYSNCGYLLLGDVLQRVKGKSYAEMLEQLVARAEMHDTGFAGPREIVPQHAAAYVREKSRWQKAPYIDWSVAYSSGGVYSTVEDLWRWRNALVHSTLFPSDMSRELFDSASFGYSFGWHSSVTDREHLKKFLSTDYDTVPPLPSMKLRLLSHSGDLPGFHSSMTIFLDGSLTLILLDNHDSSALPAIAAELIDALSQ
jgi:CubicO group peptidase (beta-lactamase class C family)